MRKPPRPAWSPRGFGFVVVILDVPSQALGIIFEPAAGDVEGVSNGRAKVRVRLAFDD